MPDRYRVASVAGKGGIPDGLILHTDQLTAIDETPLTLSQTRTLRQDPVQPPHLPLTDHRCIAGLRYILAETPLAERSTPG